MLVFFSIVNLFFFFFAIWRNTSISKVLGTDSAVVEIMANMCPYGSFTHAVVRGIPETFGNVPGEGRENGEASVDMAKAQRQFGCLTGALRQKVGLQLIEIPPDPELPESWRIEDVAVIQGSTALITRPFIQQRRSEVTQRGAQRLCS